jgi:hypothetical protein
MALSCWGLLLGLIVATSLTAPSKAYWISLGATRLDMKMRTAACIAQGDRNVCYPVRSARMLSRLATL